MGHIKDIKSNLDPQAFPGATFQIQGDVPASQCSEAKIEADDGQTFASQTHIIDLEKFEGWDLVGKKVTVVSPPENAGTHTIIFNTPHVIDTDAPYPLASSDNVYYVHNGGELILTRNVQSFAEFIHAAGHSYTIKGGKLYTTIPSDQLKNACSILFDPLT